MSLREYCKTGSFRRSFQGRAALICVCSSLAVVLTAGCGGGGSNTTPPNPTGSSSLLSGTVTDLNGAPIIGAAVTFNGQTTTSTQEGNYAIPNVVVPAGQSSFVGTIQATESINGAAWSGQNMVEVLSNQADTSNVHIVMSRSDAQNAIQGTVTDNMGHPLHGARIFAGFGPFTSTGGGLFFSNLSSFATTTDLNGAYTLPHMPPGATYTVTASFAGYVNQTLSNVAVNAPPAGPTIQPFMLSTTSSSAKPSAPTGISAVAFTTPSSPNRSVGALSVSSGTAAIKQWILAKKGLAKHRSAATTHVTLTRAGTRATPAGSFVEADLFWDYVNINNLYGYDVAQATRLTPSNFISIALLRDPLADRFSDVDLGLTPGVTYYYSVARLDTINFPSGNANAGESDPSAVVAVNPLAQISLTSPASGTTTSSKTPTLAWSAVSGAAYYQILVYDRYPTLQSDQDTTNGIQPIWPASLSSSGASLVAAPATSQTYQGPALISGHTYYWAVEAYDTAQADFTISPLQSFIAP